ncbi:MAG: ribonuclease D [Acidimicrobiales bacterium]
MSAEPVVIEDEDHLGVLLDRLQKVPRYALDTEFHREKTYWPRLALLQVAWQEDALARAADEAVHVALVDPLAVGVEGLGELLAGPGTMVAHAASQDLEVLDHVCHRLPTRLFDTQVAAGFLGLGSASLASLVERFLGKHLGKGDRLTDWSRRPLRPSQLAYAAADVAHLLVLADVICEQLSARGRLSWAEEECATLLAQPRAVAEVREAWWKLRDIRQLRGTGRGVAQEVAAWREEKARALDVPARSVLPDLALLSIAHAPPASVAALRETRGLDGRHLRGGADEEIMAAIERGRALPPSELCSPPSSDGAKELKPATALALAWVAQLARDEQVDAALLATRADVVDYLSGARGARLRQGWRAQLVGAPISRLASGEACLTLDGKGRLLMQARPCELLGSGPDGGEPAVAGTVQAGSVPGGAPDVP